MDVLDLEQAIRDNRALEHAELCRDCGGWGVKLYGSTATWRGGVGGAAMTSDVCNKCWGSGDANHPWPSHHRLQRAK